MSNYPSPMRLVFSSVLCGLLYFVPIVSFVVGAEALAQEKTTTIPTVNDAVKQLRDEMLTLMSNDRRFTDAAIQNLRDSTTVGFQNLKNQTEAAIFSADKAVSKAEEATKIRFESVNEFRAQLNDQSKTFVSKDTHDALSRQVDEMKAIIQTMQGRSGGITDGWGWAVGVLGLVAAGFSLIVFLRRTSTEENQPRRSTRSRN